MATQLRGVMAALLTPFNSEQMLDKESLWYSPSGYPYCF